MFETENESKQPKSHHKPNLRPSQGCNLDEEDDEYFAVGIKNAGNKINEREYFIKTGMHAKN